MAVLGRGLNQRGIPVFCIAGTQIGRVLESAPERKLLVDPARGGSLFYRFVGTSMAVALPAWPDQEDPDQEDIPGNLYRVHGQ